MTTSHQKARLSTRALRIAQLHHPNLVRLLPLPGGAGMTPVRNQGQALADFTAAGTLKRFKTHQLVRILLDVLNGLGALHGDVEDGVCFVHGEVSPQNVLVDDDGTARLVPLVSRHLSSQVLPVENGYTAPELLMGDRGDPRADLFSIGVMLWEALAGRRLFSDTSAGAVVTRLLDDRKPPVSAPTRDSAALRLAMIAEKAISLDPELRFQDARELRSALDAALSPRVTERSSGNWAQEAPTLAKRGPAPRPLPLRTHTPPATVLDIAPAAEPASSNRAASRANASQTSGRSGEWRRAALVITLSAAAAAVAAFMIPLPARAPGAPVAAMPLASELPLERAPVKALPPAVLAAPSASAVSEARSGGPAPAVAPRAGARPAAASSQGSAPARKLLKRPSADADYGI